MSRFSLVILVVSALGSAAPAAAAEWSFPTRVLPILTKAGCNAGACHGAATGQGGFALSLLGYHPEGDHAAITRELGGRRIDLGEPEESLILRKASRDMKHKGGLRIAADSEDYEALAAWIRDGAPYGSRELRVTGLAVGPAEVWAKGPGESAALKVTATFSDGRTQDVTAHAVYNSNDDAVAEVDERGRVTLRRRGLTAVMVRYGGQVAAVSVAAPMSDDDVVVEGFEPRNFVDRHVLDQLKRMRVRPSGLAGDAEFFRRVHLDVVGSLPTADEVRGFLREPSTVAGREAVVDRLLADERFVDLWAMRLADVLLIDLKRLGVVQGMEYHAWLRRQLSERAPLDRVARDLLTSRDEGPANFLRIAQDPRDVGEHVSSMLLGVRIACARCHAHPFAAWTQADYHEFAAFFAPGRVAHPLGGRVVSPRPLGAEKAAAGGGDPREELAAWVTSAGNPYFARAFVNRVWKHMMGRGLVEPVDDFRVSNPPTNPALLDALAADFVQGGYDLRRLVRAIASSRTYQATSKAEDGHADGGRLFGRAHVRPIGAKVLLDAIAQATDFQLTFKGHPRVTRAVQLMDGLVEFEELDVLGRCRRDVRCDDRPGGAGAGLAAALHLMNGSTVNDRVPGPVTANLLLKRRTNAEAVEELFLRTLSRPPTERERGHFLRLLFDADDRETAAEDLLWALLNSREFVFNH